MKGFLIYFIYSLLFQTFFCKVNAQQKKFTLLSSASTGINFRNDILEDTSMFLYRYEYLYIGNGVSIGDINNDGLPDIYFSSSRGSNKLYLNLGNFKFKDITLSAGVEGGEGIKTGVNLVDVNGDGYLDIFICKSGFKDPKLRKKILYINNKDLTFTNKAAEYGLDMEGYTIQSYFFDFDNDGDKDVLFINHPDDFSKTMSVNGRMEDGKIIYISDTLGQSKDRRLFENRNGKFFDITQKAGIKTNTFSLSASVVDFNNDGWPDVYVANDFNKPDNIFINNKNGTFSDKLSDYVNHVSFSSMGSDVVDLNNDGFEDIVVTDMAVEDPVRQKQLFAINQNYDKFKLMVDANLFFQYPRNTLQLNNGAGSFSEIANHAGLAETDWSWAPLVADFDNDGWKDMYISNGLKRDMTDWDYKVFVLDSIANVMNRGESVDLNKWLQSMPSVKVKNYFFHNNGSLNFDNYTNVWMDEPPSFSSGASYADLDNDGDLDLVINNVDDEAFVFKNNTVEDDKSAHYLRFRFFKTAVKKEEVYGVIVKLINDKGNIQLQHYDPQRGFLSSMEHAVHFGTGKDSIISKVEITFPSLKKIILQNIATNQLLSIYETDAKLIAPKIIENKKLFTDISNQKKINYVQKENDFIDFKREPLIPYKCSRKGPYFATADINGDGRLDIFIGGAAGTEGSIFLQNINGSFTEKKQIVFAQDKSSEDMGAVFFDADGDKDMDLYVVSGGAEFDAGSKLYQDRLYINDGKGNFTKSTKVLPPEAFNGSCVIPLDFDNDGDEDLFIGGHVLPGKFPQSDKSILLQNNKGVFTNVTKQFGKELESHGIIDAAIWSDIDNDGKKELILAGEWMPVSIYKIQNNIFEKVQSTVRFISPATQKDTAINLDEFTGWWYNAKTADLDNDGDLDIVLGNRGTNATIKGNYYNPCTVYAKDFDENGSYDAVLGYFNQGKCYPLFSRDQLIEQIPFMRKKFIRYKDYSGTTLDKLFTDEQQKGMDIYKTRFFESGVLMNEGNNSYHFIPFPEMAQLSNINDFVIDDFDDDGIKDILTCGNNNDAAVMVGNNDAAALTLLKGSNAGSFFVLSHNIDGLKARGECRKLIWEKDIKLLIILKNSQAMQVFKPN